MKQTTASKFKPSLPSRGAGEKTWLHTTENNDHT